VEVVGVRVWRWLAAAVVWAVAVAVAAAVAWFAIDLATRQVAGANQRLTLVATAPSSQDLAATSEGDVPALPPSSTARGAPAAGSGIHMATPSGTPSVMILSGVRTGTYSSAGGVVLVGCLGRESVGSATRVADGWRVDSVAEAGGGFRVLFVADDGRVARVEAACRNGQPSFLPAR
jgi:hypothetical protein